MTDPSGGSCNDSVKFGIDAVENRGAVSADSVRHSEQVEQIVQARMAELAGINSRLAREVEERKKAEALKDEFVGTVSHELRTPLSIVKEGIDLLLDEIPGRIDEKQRQVLDTSRRNIERLGRIINDLLDISKIEAGKMAIHRQAVDLASLIAQSMAPLRRRADAKGLALVVALPEGLPRVYVDEGRIIQVFTNLIHNAVTFTKTGFIRVEARAVDGFVECGVEDSGPGVAAEDLPRLFGKFVQLDRTNGAGGRGTGLGLSIVKSIIELHRGTIQCESTIGVGTRFRLTLPVYCEAEVLRETIERAIQAGRQAHEDFTLLLFEVRCSSIENRADRKEAFRTAFENVIASQSLARSSDVMCRRGDRQILLLAKMAPSQMGGLYRRWKAQIRERFGEVDKNLTIQLGCGYAEYPDHGSTPEELLAKADATLSE